MDGGKARVILRALVTRADLRDDRPMLDLLWRARFRWKTRPHHVTGDSVYGTPPDVEAVERAGIRAYTPIIACTRGERLFNKERFVYDPGRDVYVCPAGEVLEKDGVRSERQITRHIADPKTCDACELKSRCTDGKSGRAVARGFEEEFYDRVRSYRGTFAYEKALRKRKVWIEPLFAEAKDWHGMRRFRLRRLEKANIEALLIASGQYAERLLDFGGRGPSKPAQAAAFSRRPPPAVRVVAPGSIVRGAPGGQRGHSSTRWRVSCNLALRTSPEDREPPIGLCVCNTETDVFGVLGRIWA